MNKIMNLQNLIRKGFLGGGVITIIFFILFFGIGKAEAAITGQLDFGSSGLNVVELQKYLATNAKIYPSGLISGDFDSFTELAIQKFQVEQGIVFSGTPKTTGYGRVGPRTIVRLNALILIIQQNGSPSAGNPILSSSVPLIENDTSFGKQEQINIGLPMRLIIPVINVDATFKYVGLNSDGAMDMTESLNDVAWFELGPFPGDNGSAVVGGHYDGRENGVASVFDDLYKLKKGDRLYIENDKGEIISFVIRERRIYDSNADASDVFVSNDDKSHLNLIACEGVWNEKTQSYPERLVFFADKE